MQITVFAKRRQTKEGKTFFNYLATMVNRNGDEIPCQVKFREGAGQPKPELCPMNILFDKRDANFTTREYTDPNTAEVRKAHVLWVSQWEQGSDYVDHSLDDFD